MKMKASELSSVYLFKAMLSKCRSIEFLQDPNYKDPEMERLCVNPNHISNISHKTVAFLIDPASVWEDSHNFNIVNNDNAYHQLKIYHTADSGLGTIHVLLHFFILTELQTRVLKPCLRWKKIKSQWSQTIHSWPYIIRWASGLEVRLGSLISKKFYCCGSFNSCMIHT